MRPEEASEADGPAIPGVTEDDDVPTLKEPVHRTPANGGTDGSEPRPRRPPPTWSPHHFAEFRIRFLPRRMLTAAFRTPVAA